ncbi:hypothetical protein D9M71_58550 [compost metagenome]
MVTGQDELAFAGQGLGQGAQVFLLDEVTFDHGGFGQLPAQGLQVECPGLGVEAQQGHQAKAMQQQSVHARAFCTASMNTFGDANCISRLTRSTATCTELARVKRSALTASLMR